MSEQKNIRQQLIEKFLTGYKITREDWVDLLTSYATIDEAEKNINPATIDEVIGGTDNENFITSFLLNYAIKNKIITDGSVGGTSTWSSKKISELLGDKVNTNKIINDLTTGGTENVASAEVAKYLKGYIDGVIFSNLQAQSSKILYGISSSATSIALAETSPTTNVSLSLTLPTTGSEYFIELRQTMATAGIWSTEAKYETSIPISGFNTNSTYALRSELWYGEAGSGTKLRTTIIAGNESGTVGVDGATLNSANGGKLLFNLDVLVAPNNINYEANAIFVQRIYIKRVSGAAGNGIVFTSTSAKPLYRSRTGGAIDTSNIYNGNTPLNALLESFFPKNSYSKVITTQEEFDAIIASSTWLDATSVAFVGNFTANAHIVIPDNVKRIDGYNEATISTTGYYSFGYSVNLIDSGYSISGMNFVNFEINNCQYLSNCICTTDNNLDCYCFKGSSYIFNCTAKSTSLSGIAYCYTGCSNIVNCSASSIGVTGSAACYVNSYKIINSIALANSSNGDSNGFINSSNILNCNASSVSAKSVAYGFNGCYQVNNCKATATNKYSQSYKSTAINATYACANTDAGGWNQ